MKILEVITSMDIGGAETHVLELCLELKRQGHEVTLVSDKGVYIEKIKENNIKYVFAPFLKRDPNSLKNAINTLQKELLNAHEMIHAHTRYTLFVLNLAKRAVKTAPTIATCHLCFSLGLKRPFSFWGDATLAVSEDIKSYLVREYGVDREKIVLTSNGVDTERFIGAKKENTILHVSRFDKGRSLCALLLCKIAPRLLNQFKNWKILLIGDGDDSERVKAAVNMANEELGYEAIIYKGKSTEVASECGRAAVFVGVSRAAIEAMSCECQVVLCGNEGYGGVLSEDNFFDALSTNLCARKNKAATPDILLRDLLYLVSEYDQNNTLGKSLRRLVCAHLSRRNMAKDLMVAYEIAKQHEGMTKSLIVGYFGHGNMGDEATLEILKKQLTSLGFEPPHPVLYAPNGVMDLGEFNRVFAKKLTRCDTVIFGGGNLLQNETSNRSLFYYLEIIRRAKKNKKRVILLGSGIGRISGKIAEARCAMALRGCDFVGLRTYDDLKLYESLAEKKADCFMPDICFCLDEVNCSGDGDYILYIPKEYNRTVIEQIKEKSMLLGKKIVVMALFEEQDKRACDRVKNELNCELALPKNTEEALAKIKGACFIVTERLHGAVFALTQKREAFIRTGSEKALFLYKTVRTAAQSLCIPCPLHTSEELSVKKIGAVTDSDFEKLLLFFKSKINFALEVIKERFN